MKIQYPVKLIEKSKDLLSEDVKTIRQCPAVAGQSKIEKVRDLEAFVSLLGLLSHCFVERVLHLLVFLAECFLLALKGLDTDLKGLLSVFKLGLD